MTTPRSDGKMRLGAFLMPTGHHVASWRHPDADADAGINFGHYVRLAQTADEPPFGGFYSLQLNSYSTQLLHVRHNEAVRQLGLAGRADLGPRDAGPPVLRRLAGLG